jgi:hypothetical protein
MSQAGSYHQAKKILAKDVFLPKKLSDNLADVSENISSDSESDSDDSVRVRKIVHQKVQ